MQRPASSHGSHHLPMQVPNQISKTWQEDPRMLRSSSALGVGIAPPTNVLHFVRGLVQNGTTQTLFTCFDRSIGLMLGNLTHKKWFRFLTNVKNKHFCRYYFGGHIGSDSGLNHSVWMSTRFLLWSHAGLSFIFRFGVSFLVWFFLREEWWSWNFYFHYLKGIIKRCKYIFMREWKKK